ncbi:hypothetical protein DFJ74DRAFT_657036 [Hyaloraphidium curvatum]|nr:hypothetical protein DFJ74DRAFT_657036 [Hyaloraphidium curvatum]
MPTVFVRAAVNFRPSWEMEAEHGSMPMEDAIREVEERMWASLRGSAMPCFNCQSENSDDRLVAISTRSPADLTMVSYTILAYCAKPECKFHAGRSSEFELEMFESIGCHSSRACTGCRRSFRTGELQRCGKCKHSFYCSRDCQAKDWPHHKPECFKPPARPPAEKESLAGARSVLKDPKSAEVLKQYLMSRSI